MQNCHCFHIKLLHWPVLLSCLGLSCKMSFKSWLIDNFMNLTWIHLAKKSLRAHTLACVMTCWRPIQSFINVLSFPFLPDCSVVVFLCNTFMVFSLGFFLNFLFCQMNVQKLIPKYIWFHLYIKTCRKNDACSDVSFFCCCLYLKLNCLS